MRSPLRDCMAKSGPISLPWNGTFLTKMNCMPCNVSM